MLLVCPLCKNELDKYDNIYKCKLNHCYDIAKEGYVNLLLSNQKNSLMPGDNNIMTTARKNFLSMGYYDTLLTKICDILSCKKYIKYIADLGCGTGYYTSYIEKKIKPDYTFGIDISKYALKCASKMNKNIVFAVSSVFSVPLKSESMDLILNIFAPKAEKEFYRVLKKDGIILEVVPGKYHLYELKNKLYNNDTYENESKKYLNSFKLISEDNLKFNTNISGKENIENLLKMTPYFYTTSSKSISNILNMQNINITFDFIIRVYEK